MMIIRKILIYSIYLYVLALPILSDNFLSGRAGDLILLLIFIVYSLGILINREIRERFINGLKNFYNHKLDLFMVILFITMGFSVFYASDKSIAISETLRFLSYIILYFIIKYEVIDERLKENILKLYILITAVLSIMGFVQHFTNIGLNKGFINIKKIGVSNRIAVTLTNPNNYGAYLILAVFPILFLAIKESKLRRKLIYSILFILILTNIFFTYSRNAWLGFAIGCLVLVIFYSWKFIFAFGIIGILGLFIPQIYNRLSQVSDPSQNVTRVNLWKIGLYMIKDHPVLGVGNGNYASLYNRYAQMHEKLRYFNLKVFPCHNSYLKIQAELGVMGTLSFLGVLVTAWINVKKVLKECSNGFINNFYTGFLASITAFYFMNIFDNLFFVPKTTSYFFMLLALSQSYLYKKTA